MGGGGGRCPREPSEEVRALLSGQLLLVLKLAAKAVAAYAAEVIQVTRLCEHPREVGRWVAGDCVIGG